MKQLLRKNPMLIRFSMALMLLLLATHSVQAFHITPPARVGNVRRLSPTASSLRPLLTTQDTVPIRRQLAFPLRLTDLPQSEQQEEGSKEGGNDESGETPPDDAEPKRVRVDFENFLKGMTNMGGGGGSAAPPTAAATEEPAVINVEDKVDDEQRDRDHSWFDPIQEKIEAKYAEIRETMLQQLEKQRQEDPASVPENAQLVMETVWQQEMEEEISVEREKAARELLAEYESNERKYTDSLDLSGTENSETALYLQEELKEEEDRRAALQARIDEFVRYEEDSFRRAAEKEIVQPDSGGNLDTWALERLEDMLASRQDDDDASIMYSLEESIEELRAQIEKEQARGSIRPETMKEWQMYRSIATRMLKNETGVDEDDQETSVESKEDEEAIASQLQSWKSFQEKEQVIRKKSGLARGPQMPFDWNEAGKNSVSDLDSSPEVEDTRSRVEIRDEVNLKAIDAMEEMIERSQDPIRKESLQRSLDALRSGIEAEKAAGDEAFEFVGGEDATGPVDISDIFDSGVPTKQTFSRTESKKPLEDVMSPLDTVSVAAGGVSERDESPPDTPFFSGAEDDDNAAKDSPPPQPKTPFFEDADDGGFDTEKVVLESSKLGTIDEQKLRTMYRRAGAVTEEEQENIKQQWEMFQSIEKQKRDSSGLSDTDDPASLSGVGLSYDISEVLKDDGDIDAEKVLSRIGPRPKRTRSKQGSSSATASASTIPRSDHTSAGSEKSTIDSGEISDPLFRSISAIGGDPKKDDPVAKAKERSAFEEFVQKEDRARETLEEMDASSFNGTLEQVDVEASAASLDDVSYAKEVLSSIGPRPTREPKPVPTGTESKDGVFAREGEDELAPTREGDESEYTKTVEGLSGAEFDDSEDEEYEKNMRQLREYEERRSPNRPRQMGIDISDVFEGDSSADDYGDYSYSDWETGRSFSSFDARKSNMLGQSDLSAREMNALMDHKNSEQQTFVSQYLPRVKKPFRDFGAIFRLEGTLLDITGFQYEAWKKTADIYGYTQPRLEDVRFAAVMNPEAAPRKVFFWTDDFMLCKEIARTHRGAMADVFMEWMKGNDVSYNRPKQVAAPLSNAVAPIAKVRAPIIADNFEDAIEIQGSAWTATAEQFGFSDPTLDEVIFASAISPDDAVMNAFRWSTDAGKVSEIVRAYQGFVSYYADIEDDNGGPDASEVVSSMTVGDEHLTSSWNEPLTSTESLSSPATLTENDMLEIQYRAWVTIAEDHDLEPPSPDEALGAMVINDPALVVKDGFAWTDDPLLVAELVTSYQTLVRKLVRERVGETAPEKDVSGESPHMAAVGSLAIGESSDEARQESLGPTKEEILEMQVFSWIATAQKHSYGEPSTDDLQAAIYAEPEDAVLRVFCWTDDDQVARDVASTYKEEMKKASKKYIQQYDLKVKPTTAKMAAPKIEESNGPSNEELFQAASDAWEKVANERGFTPPDADQVQFAMAVGPKDALTTFRWTEDLGERNEILEAYLEAVRETSSKWKSGYKLGGGTKQEPRPLDDGIQPYTVVPGVRKWLHSLADVEMPTGVISYLDRDQVDVLLEQSGLDEFFPVDRRVTASNEYRTESQQMLGGALRLERRPDHCVVFDVSPQASVAAHDVGMKSIAVVGVYPMYELITADSTTRHLEDLTAMNVRRLFAERVYDQPMVDTLEERPDPRKLRKVKTRFWEEGDRS